MIFSNHGNAETQVIRYGIPSEGYPPYEMGGERGLHGIVGDAFLEFAEQAGLKIKLVKAPRKRIRVLMDRGEIDVITGAIEWEDKADDYVWSRGIILVSDNIVMASDQASPAKNAKDLTGHSVVVMQDYMYPSLDKLIKSGDIKTHETDKFENLLRMVERKRVDFGIVDENVARWVIRDRGLDFEKPLRFVTPGFDEVQFRVIMLSKKWQPWVSKLDAAIAKFKRTDRWQEILQRYR